MFFDKVCKCSAAVLLLCMCCRLDQYIIIIILFITFMQGIYNYLPTKNHISMLQLYYIYSLCYM